MGFIKYSSRQVSNSYMFWQRGNYHNLEDVSTNHQASYSSEKFLCCNYSNSLDSIDPCIFVQFIKKIQQDATIYQNFIISHLHEAQHVSGDTLPIIRSIKLHWQPLVFHMWNLELFCYFEWS
jgi:hypothetical protein